MAWSGRKTPPRGPAAAVAIAIAMAAGGGTAASADGAGQYAIGAGGDPLWAEQAAAVARLAPILPFSGAGQGRTPFPLGQAVPNTAGASATYQPESSVAPDQIAFFQPLGRNGRSCASCHVPAAGWSITPPQIRALFDRTGGADPLFQPVDGANCPTADLSSLPARRRSQSLLLAKGLIRVFEQVAAPPDLQYSIVAVSDPYGCSSNPATGLTSYGAEGITAGLLSVYRRPLPATNLGVLSTIMFDGRETSLRQQAIDADRIHAQAATPPTRIQLAQMIYWENDTYAAQTVGVLAGGLAGDGATGGPAALWRLPFYPGINDAFGADPNGIPFNPDVYTLYAAWLPRPTGAAPAATDAAANGRTGQARAAIARGEAIFNERRFSIRGVGGLNDEMRRPSISGTCSTCHDTPNAGSHSLNRLMNTGPAAASAIGLDTAGLPLFTLRCNAGPLAGQTVTVTDPGRAILSGRCADIGRLKVPTLRNLAARPPYFHNGSATTLADVVTFYDARFGIGLSARDKADLAAFLAAL
jgi:cytochrome c peroxidase